MSTIHLLRICLYLEPIALVTYAELSFSFSFSKRIQNPLLAHILKGEEVRGGGGEVKY
jgi:hypothetical protein